MVLRSQTATGGITCVGERFPSHSEIMKQFLENSRPQLSVSKFSQKDVDLGRLQYVHASNGAGRDAFDFNISSPHVTKGPYSLYFDIYEHHVRPQDMI